MKTWSRKSEPSAEDFRSDDLVGCTVGGHDQQIQNQELWKDDSRAHHWAQKIASIYNIRRESYVLPNFLQASLSLAAVVLALAETVLAHRAPGRTIPAEAVGQVPEDGTVLPLVQGSSENGTVLPPVRRCRRPCG